MSDDAYVKRTDPKRKTQTFKYKSTHNNPTNGNPCSGEYTGPQDDKTIQVPCPKCGGTEKRDFKIVGPTPDALTDRGLKELLKLLGAAGPQDVEIWRVIPASTQEGLAGPEKGFHARLVGSSGKDLPVTETDHEILRNAGATDLRDPR
jgi:hypothetical protein